ncbi:SAM-dependent methyltransferase [Pleurocapsa sp. CCALA 161]|uniref:class I SAM-dependent methyltransferase n=1 Tax=Pleurocapsa sp. CCALA 161 TaxID=2107688 RepID=UPI000D0495BD|nr:class I SAM-dependent methyltransferase [Pleurocapsa sp. CCALA 161]PSB06392.1 SAM-dependent methyltransferase [Pleurocapsa sp. CCALA 161]
MPNKTIGLSDVPETQQQSLYDYLLSVSLREPEVLTQLRQETAAIEDGDMQIAPDQGQFMVLLIKLINAKKTLEIGTFTGYSTLCVALALPDDGKIIACDVDEEYTAIATRYWQAAGVADKIQLNLAPALDTLDRLLETGQANTFDFAFIDADKDNYDAYYEKCLQLVRPGGLIAIDNTLWCGRVVDPERQDKDTIAIRNLNQKLKGDRRVELSLLTISDGLTLALKKS